MGSKRTLAPRGRSIAPVSESEGNSTRKQACPSQVDFNLSLQSDFSSSVAASLSPHVTGMTCGRSSGGGTGFCGGVGETGSRHEFRDEVAEYRENDVRTASRARC